MSPEAFSWFAVCSMAQVGLPQFLGDNGNHIQVPLCPHDATGAVRDFFSAVHCHDIIICDRSARKRYLWRHLHLKRML